MAVLVSLISRSAVAFVVLLLVMCLTVLNQAQAMVSNVDIARVAQFVKEHGGFISPFLEPRFTGAAGWALFFNGTQNDTKKQNKKSHAVLKVPKRILICNTTENTNLVENVLREWKTNTTFWGPYFATLPKRMDMLWDWTNDELDRLENPNFAKRIKRFRASQVEFYRELSKKLEFQFTLEEYKLVYAWVASRAFNVNSWHCLVPFADFPNHDLSSPDAYWRWTTKNTTGETMFEMRSEAWAVKDREFTIPYLYSMSNDDALTEYGFADVNSQSESLDFLLPDNIENQKRKERILRFITLAYDMNIGVLLRYFRVLIATTAELDAQKVPPVGSEFGSFWLPLSWKRELEAAKLCAKELRRYRPTIKLRRKEFQYLYNRTLSWREKTILAYRIPYDRLFERAGQLCEHMVEFILCSTPQRLKRVWAPRTTPNPKLLTGLIDNGFYKEGQETLCQSTTDRII